MGLKELEKYFKGLANRRRLEIILYLQKVRTTSVTDLAAHIHLSFKSTSRHLTVLRLAGIVERNQIGLIAVYSLILPPLKYISEIQA